MIERRFVVRQPARRRLVGKFKYKLGVFDYRTVEQSAEHSVFADFRAENMTSSVKRSAKISIAGVAVFICAFCLRSKVDRFGYIRIENIISFFYKVAPAEKKSFENIIFRKFDVVAENVLEHVSSDVG